VYGLKHQKEKRSKPAPDRPLLLATIDATAGGF
jgi:hypothetical protein